MKRITLYNDPASFPDLSLSDKARELQPGQALMVSSSNDEIVVFFKADEKYAVGSLATVVHKIREKGNEGSFFVAPSVLLTESTIKGIALALQVQGIELEAIR